MKSYGHLDITSTCKQRKREEKKVKRTEGERGEGDYAGRNAGGLRKGEATT